MFGPPDDPPCLRQGDIVADLFFALPRQAAVRYLGTYRNGTEVNVSVDPVIDRPAGARRQYLSALTLGVVGHGAVMSQCCDLDRTHPKASFVVCRLIPLDRARFRNIEALIANINPYGDAPAHLQFFFLGEIPGLAGEYIADFALTLTVPWNEYEYVLRKKILQLDPVNRNRFRVKVGAHYGRPTPEDVAAGLENPYLHLPADVAEPGAQANAQPGEAAGGQRQPNAIALQPEDDQQE
jgi:hypothetical protein